MAEIKKGNMFDQSWQYVEGGKVERWQSGVASNLAKAGITPSKHSRHEQPVRGYETMSPEEAEVASRRQNVVVSLQEVSMMLVAARCQEPGKRIFNNKDPETVVQTAVDWHSIASYYPKEQLPALLSLMEGIVKESTKYAIVRYGYGDNIMAPEAQDALNVAKEIITCVRKNIEIINENVQFSEQSNVVGDFFRGSDLSPSVLPSAEAKTDRAKRQYPYADLMEDFFDGKESVRKGTLDRMRHHCEETMRTTSEWVRLRDQVIAQENKEQ